MGDIDVVHAFLEAWDRRDLDGAFALMSPDIVYKNTGFPDAVGHEGVRKTLGAMIDSGTALTAVIHAIAATGDGRVLTERTDTIHYPKGAVSIPVMGAFDIKDGQISGWRDYFDASPFKAAAGA